MRTRRQQASDVRDNATELARSRPHPRHANNGEEQRYRNADNKPSYLANFTKGLPHDPETGLLANPRDYELFVLGIQSAAGIDFEKTPLGPAAERNETEMANGCASKPKIVCSTESAGRCEAWSSTIAREKVGKDKKKGADLRAWESAGAGMTFDLEGPDSESVTMPPAPRLDSHEIVAEMAEIYWMALLRDVPFTSITNGLEPLAQAAHQHLASLPWLKRGELSNFQLTEEERSRREKRLEADGSFSFDRLFRGQTPGEDVGPYLSQFLLVGNDSRGSSKCNFGPKEGMISYGAIRADQRVRLVTPKKDFMTTWEAWLDVQQGADLKELETYECSPKVKDKTEEPAYRFITTPRDLATYVHHDALYEAYLNACLILLGMKAPFDPGLPFLGPDTEDKQQGFAQFGGPHILSLVTEVATRALKAVRYQKYNVHRRLRPEALAGRIDAYGRHSTEKLFRPVANLVAEIGPNLLERITKHNEDQNKADDRKKDPSAKRKDIHLLPMAFPEGSPMHPSYGAGHGTVAGACVTILKAFFDHGWELPFSLEPSADGSKLVPTATKWLLTVEGELNKLAGNIAIGRNWAGVHYYTDYIESMRLGERIALGVLEEQKLTYGENFTMTVPLFDGGAVRI